MSSGEQIGLIRERMSGRSFLKKIAVGCAILVVSAAVSAGPLEDGQAAYLRGDYSAAFRYWRVGADQGSSDAQTLLGTLYDHGKGTPINHVEAAKWFRKAAQQGNARAQYYLAASYAAGNGVPKDFAAAASWARKSADQGNPKAQFSLGLLYSNGLGVPLDNVKAHMWFSLAAAVGEKDAEEKRREVSAKMSSEQMAKARKLAREWLQRHPRN